MTALICGSMAYDTIMVFPDRFRHHILPEQVHILNVCFLVPELRREYGGCAGNIAYNLKLLGGNPLPMATVGKDFTPYAQWLDLCGIRRDYLRVLDESYTAQAYITTDMDDNQITAFHPGAMSMSHHNHVPHDAGVRIGIVAPDGKEGMIQHAKEFSEAGIPFILDPGQGLPMFDGPEILELVEQARWLALNDYESSMMQEKTGLSLARLAERVEALIVTRGAEGALIFADGEVLEVPVAAVEAVRDPTGCGDAFRAGLLFGIMEDMDWVTTGRIASLMGAIKIEHHGTQNHSFNLDGFRERFLSNFAYQF